jgi:hypothetical protein
MSILTLSSDRIAGVKVALRPGDRCRDPQPSRRGKPVQHVNLRIYLVGADMPDYL